MLSPKIKTIKTIHYILYYLAGVILLLHNLIPHAHHGEMSFIAHEEEHRLANSPIDWFLLSFHNDLGEDHLECFSEIEHPNLDISVQFISANLNPFPYHFSLSSSPNTSLNYKIASSAILTPTNQPNTGRFHLSDAPLRAPPYQA